MTILPLHPAENASPAALHGFLTQCRAAAIRDGHAKLVSISLAVDALDPLAVLESIFEPGEPHFYAERATLETAVAGAEVAVAHESCGPGRFADVQHWMDDVLAHTIAVGDVEAPFGGPHVFAGFSFANEVEPGERFPAAYAFVPRWQVSLAGATTTAVANLLVAADADLDALAERVWRAHAKFRRFEYASAHENGAGSGTGVPPVGSTQFPDHGRDARATANSSEVHVRQGAYLPHWTRDGAIYAVTFRLVDSLPPHVLETWRLERTAIEQRAQNRALTALEQNQLHRLYSERIEAFLDAGAGECLLRQAAIAKVVAGALKHFDGSHYELHDWCIMPNHVHVVLRPLGAHDLSTILQNWKSYTAKEANRALHRQGSVWQPEYYDHLIRDEAEYAHAADYIRRNPEQAGLKNWEWIGRGTGVSPVGSEQVPDHGRDARATFTSTEAGDYRAGVRHALKRIADGEFKKIVLARASDVTADQPLHPLQMLNGLRQRFPDCYSFSFSAGRRGTASIAAPEVPSSFIGASPERLVRVSKGQFETEALAGSIRRGAGASEDAALATALLRSEKDRREQREVLDDIVTRLAPLGIVAEHPAEPLVRRLANVQHLHTPLRAPLPVGVRLLDALAALHPTPAVGGSPRDAALARIRELEGFPRGLYAGALGWLNSRGGGEFFVGIRSALVEGRRARIYAGAGIVAGSTPEKEFAETELKFKAMLDALLT